MTDNNIITILIIIRSYDYSKKNNYTLVAPNCNASKNKIRFNNAEKFKKKRVCQSTENFYAMSSHDYAIT